MLLIISLKLLLFVLCYTYFGISSSFQLVFHHLLLFDLLLYGLDFLFIFSLLLQLQMLKVNHHLRSENLLLPVFVHFVLLEAPLVLERSRTHVLRGIEP
jgi:hypothetical protein